MSKRRVIAVSVVLLMLVMASSLPATRADGGYRGWADPNPIARMRLHYAGMVKPIDNLRNYDGTTDAQVPGYRTLWTGRYPDCGTPTGEGTGGHPGVDISANCGTPVRAAGEGRVIYARTNWASVYPTRTLCADNSDLVGDWGNRVVILHNA